MKKFEFKKGTKTDKYFHGVKLSVPTESEYKKYIKMWNDRYAKNDYINHETILDLVFKENNHSNKVVKEMFIKCVLLDKFYSTNIKHMDDLIYHLTMIDENQYKTMLANGNAELVNIMKEVKLGNNEKINYLSFASKYCKRYNEKCFPIYDTIVKDVLKYYVETTHFYKDKIDWTDYASYKKVVDEFMKTYPFIENYVMLDRYLWIMGKEKLAGINYIKQINKANQKELSNIAKKVNHNGNLTKEELKEFIVRKHNLFN